MSPSEEKPYSLSETWSLNNRVNLMLLEQLSDDQLDARPSPDARVRSVGDQFAHVHNIRIYWLKAQAPVAARGLKEIEKGSGSKRLLKQSLEASAEAIAGILAESEASGKMKSWKRGPAAFLGYLLAHEGHHRGQIILHLKYAKQPIDKTFAYDLWDWQKI